MISTPLDLNTSGFITLNIKHSDTSFLKVSFEITCDELINEITPDLLFTVIFSYKLINNRENSKFYLDFDLVWTDLATKIHKTYNILTDIFSKAPIQEGKLLKVEFYRRISTSEQLARINTKHYNSLSTSFSQSEFIIDLKKEKDVETKVLSIIFWMMLEPNMVAAVKLPNGDYYLMMDIHRLYFKNQFGSAISGGFAPPSNYKEYQAQFNDVFKHLDTMNFLSFHNHELSKSHGDMISYIMEKFIGFYRTCLNGPKNSQIFDLR